MRTGRIWRNLNPASQLPLNAGCRSLRRNLTKRKTPFCRSPPSDANDHGDRDWRNSPPVRIHLRSLARRAIGKAKRLSGCEDRNWLRIRQIEAFTALCKTTGAHSVRFSNCRRDGTRRGNACVPTTARHVPRVRHLPASRAGDTSNGHRRPCAGTCARPACSRPHHPSDGVALRLGHGRRAVPVPRSSPAT
jgi:hypothetical protein